MTKTTSTTTSKTPQTPRTTKAATTKAPAATVTAPAASVVSEVNKKAFYERVAEASGAKKNKIKPVVDAVLAELGEALMAGEEMNLPPLGKLSVNRQKDAGNAHVLITKIRRSKPMLEKVAAEKAAVKVADESGGEEG
ncbi:HU family DNA-binding protein [Celeribacter sp.]|uniref:HU family DNA-binding protein n=1 Tax=Celeribacter sp. TaxID=1890673 RepID=UPI003A8F6749